MKKKTVVIMGIKNNGMPAIGRTEAIVHRIREEFKAEGRVERSVKNWAKGKAYHYEDGSVINVLSCGTALSGIRCTHLYIDSEASQLPNFHEYFHNAVLPFMIQSETEAYASMDIEESVENRMFYFQQAGKEVSVQAAVIP